MERVRKWLEDPAYDDGVRLYNEIGSNDFLKSIFRQGENEYNRKKLFDELYDLLPEKSEFSEIPEFPAPGKQNDFLLKKLRHDRQQVYRQIDANMFALRQARSDASRKEHAFQILRLQRKKQNILDDIDHLELHGTLPPATKKTEFTTPEIQRLYVQIWKVRKRLERTDLRNRDKSQKLLDDKLALLKKLREEANHV
ncbi:hypothetical protein FAZ19_19715 [Sphingobacterium alkalisoli]|uniref:Uncharacterized protein n=1 Tax=Sphingobacterium alkalisoli TaxID=1874115 RepID=A0A4U0GUN7_9SPHI|nr:hypothetical protein [Sphingobacterium alkalisoli]TJY62698.1 hypothetical protein FAZ19_19715 [Sphingobacterium alkalisoli]GGH28290.1 hypothetical protein GCM10011418_38840 [Sphingobacterium alkalisoli]